MAKSKNTMKKRIITSAGAAAIALGGAGVLPMTAALLPQATAATQGTNFYTSSFKYVNGSGEEISEADARNTRSGFVYIKYNVTFSSGAPEGTQWSLDNIKANAVGSDNLPDRTVEKDHILSYDIGRGDGTVSVRVTLNDIDDPCVWKEDGGYPVSGEMKIPVNSTKDSNDLIDSINSQLKTGKPAEYKDAIGQCESNTTPQPPTTDNPTPKPTTPDNPTTTPDAPAPGDDKDEDTKTTTSETPAPEDDEGTETPETPTPGDEGDTGGDTTPPPSIDDILPPSDDTDEGDTDEDIDDTDEDSTDTTSDSTEGHTQGGQVASPDTTGNGFSDGSKSSLPKWRKSDGGESISVDDDDKVGPEVKTGGAVKSASVFDKIRALFS